MLDRDACAASWSGGCQLSLLARLAVAFYLPRSSMLKYISSSVIYVVAIVVIRFLACRESFSMQASITKAQSRSDLYPRQRCEANGYMCQVRRRKNVRRNGSKKTTTNDKATKARYNCKATRSRL
ncbi:hypothetical protein EJ05DRAFT_270441 [Pseudovirgaria hyperparasitica]|uniref:Uncharacterized protein n=1 Tax=Pseudovirgaria hyperparasitica TaxID=470096 RepID=A0A6A6VPU3_9PEZI|nr:uncharacterized protein EJ05DRAFT_270441 [Pseudovirgaria hyperparasitica]KAF2752658.1 hypothetical protein EJ05DRAFT_270441 [Pseudovirgaria hyperparasitica]